MRFIYLAGPWIDREKMPEIAAALATKGHRITHKWWEYEGKGEQYETTDFMRECAEKDLEGVLDADYVVVLNTAKSEGKAVEQGIAIAMGIPIICWTPAEQPTSNIFHHLELYTHVKTLEEVLNAIK